MLHFRWRRATMAAVASLCASAVIAPAAIAAPGDLPDLVQSIPTAPAATPDADTGQVNWGGFFDDHSIGGDNHMGWSHSGSDPEALMVRFQSTLTNAGNGALQLCGYPSSSAAWLRAYQTTPGDLAACPGNAPSSGASGWFRYAVANHSATGEFNRWHLMDLQRFALVPVNAPGARTQWDTRWGTCMNDNQFMDCEHNAGATNLRAGIAPHTDKVTEEGAPDQTVVAFPNRIPNGSYQLVAISNPYGAIREAGTTYGSVSCVSLQVSGDAEVGEWRVYQAGATPANCLLPTNIPGALTGPGGTDPFAGANPAAACNPLLITGHCWDTIPVDGAHPIAHTNVRDTSTATATRTVAQYGAVGTYGPGGGGGNPGGGGGGGRWPRSRRRAWFRRCAAPGVIPPTRARSRSRRSRTARPAPTPAPPSAGRSARCRARRRSRAGRPAAPTRRAPTSWKRSGGKSYSGTVRVWFTSTTTQVSWNYDLSVQRKQRGHRTTTTTRSARVGGRSPRGRRSSAGRSREGVFATRDAFHRNPRRAAGVTRRRR